MAKETLPERTGPTIWHFEKEKAGTTWAQSATLIQATMMKTLSVSPCEIRQCNEYAAAQNLEIATGKLGHPRQSKLVVSAEAVVASAIRDAVIWNPKVPTMKLEAAVVVIRSLCHPSLLASCRLERRIYADSAIVTDR